MTNASQEYVAVSSAAEGTFGGAISTPTMLKFNHRGHTLGAQLQYAQSQLVRDDRNPVDFVQVDRTAGGELRGELQYDASGAQSVLIGDALQSAAIAAESSDIAISASGATLTGTGLGTASEIGDIVRVNFGGAYLAHARVTAVGGADAITVDTTAFDSLATLTCRRGGRTKNGNTQRSRNIERGHTGASLYEVLTGMVVSGFRVSATYKQMVQTSFQFLGSKSNSRGSSAISGASYTAAPTTQVYNCTSHVARIYLGGATATFTRYDLAVSNALRAQAGVGSLGATGVGAGGFGVAGQADFYFANYTEYEKFLGATDSSATLIFRNTAGQSMAFSLPTMVYTGGDISNEGQDSDLFCRMSFAGKYTSAMSGTFRVHTFSD